MSTEKYQIPEVARAGVLQERDKPYDVIKDHPVKKPGESQVLVKLSHTGVCMSDCLAWKTKWSPVVPCKFPFVGGHEGIGRVVAHGPGVSSPPLGSRVGIRWDGYACGTCEVCLQGVESACSENVYHGFHMDGTFQEYVVANAAFVIPVPESISAEQAAPIMCAGLTVFKGLKRAKPLPGQWVAVPGAGGGLGHLAVQYAKAFGCRVVGIDHGSKEEFAKECGCEAFIDFSTSKDVVEDVIKVTGGGAHVSVVTTHFPGAYTQAIGYARKLGTVVCLGLTVITLSTFTAAGKQLNILGSITGGRLDAKEALDLAVRGIVKCKVDVRDLDQLESTLEELEAGKIQGRVVLKISDEVPPPTATNGTNGVH